MRGIISRSKKKRKSRKRADAQALARTKRRHEVGALYLQGFTQHALAERFKVNQSTISKDLAWVQSQWVENSALEIDALKARELAKIDELERTAWDAWRKSCENFERKKAVVAGDKKRAEHTTEGQCGDPRFLDRVESCIRLRLGILGVATERKRFEHSGPGDDAIKVIEIPANRRDEDKQEAKGAIELPDQDEK
jgi:hypothetical protein